MYGWTPESFIQALRNARVTSLIDIRRRRGVRGPLYRFANASALQNLVATHAIRYIAEPALAPTEDIRDIQRSADKSGKERKSDRHNVTPEFAAAYRSWILDAYDRTALAALLKEAGERPAFLCVERLPSACHRGILASWLQQVERCEVVHLTPTPP